MAPAALVEPSSSLRASKKKLKNSIEELFAKGRRLPVFSDITVDAACQD
jgi:hypothetical protein